MGETGGQIPGEKGRRHHEDLPPGTGEKNSGQDGAQRPEIPQSLNAPELLRSHLIADDARGSQEVFPVDEIKNPEQ